MNIVVVGLSHKTASVDIREKVAFAPLIWKSRCGRSSKSLT